MGFSVFARQLLFIAFATLFTTSLVAQQKLPPIKTPVPKPTFESGPRSGYVWADNPVSPEYKPSSTYSFNSSGKEILIRRSDVGRYSVLFAGLGGKGGNALVTAYGGGNEACKVQSFGSDKNDPTTFVVNVLCFDTNGKSIDTSYTARVMWAETAFGKNGYALAGNPTGASYMPNPMYSHNSSGGTINIERSSVGTYAVRFMGLGGRGMAGGNVLITALGDGSETCKVAYWSSGGSDFIASVRCYGSGGKAADTQFSINVAW